MTNTPDLRELISSRLKVPTLPEVVTRIQALVDDPTTGAAEIGAIVGEDAPLAAKVLRIANSVYYGLAGRCMSTERATTVLGTRMLRNIVTQVSAFEAFEHLEKEWGADVRQLWEHAMRTAQVCAYVGAKSKLPAPAGAPECHACGLLHDIGKVVMLDGLGAAYMGAVASARVTGKPLHVVENERFGFDHTEVGSIVAGRWSFPKAMIDAIRYHHGPPGEIAQDAMTAVVALSDALVHQSDAADEPGVRSALDGSVCAQLGLDPTDVEDIVAFVLVPADASADGNWHSDPW